jgi:hypothetical protein
MTIRSISAAGIYPTGASVGTPLHDVLADIVTIQPSRLAGVGRGHRNTIRPEQSPLQQCWRLRPCAGRPAARALFENGMNPVPELAVDDGLVLAGIRDALVHGVADVDPVVQDSIENALVEQLTVTVGGTCDDQLPCQQGGRL